MTKIKKYLLVAIIFGCFIPNVFIFAQNSTATDINVLNSKIELLEKIVTQNINTTQWVVGSFIFIFLTIMGLSIFSSVSINKNKIEGIKKELNNLIDSQNSIAKDNLEKTLEKNNNDFKKNIDDIINRNKDEFKKYREELFLEIKKQENKWSAENSRNMAYNCKNLKSFGLAFMYALDAAFYFEKLGETSLPSAWLEEVEENLMQGTIYEYDAKFFDDNLSSIRSSLSSLKDKYEIKISRIEKLLEERIDAAKKVSLLPSPK